MKETTLALPQLGMIAITRGMLGAGIGLLLGDRISPPVRKAAGLTLLAVGIITTVPLALQVLSGQKQEAKGTRTGPVLADTWEQREAIRAGMDY